MNALEAAPGGKTPAPRPRHSEIATRVASALVLAVVALAAVVVSPGTFAVLVIVAGVIVAWEWGRLIRGTEFDSIAWIQAATVAAIVISVTLGRPEFAALAFLMAFAIIGFLSRATKNLAWSIAGMAYAGLPAFALVWLRSDKTLGVAALLYLLAVAWTTDSTSYAAGRLIGGPKLAPTISPRKTWAGLIVGTIAPALIGYAGALLSSGTSGTRLAFVSMVIAAACQVGDLSESALKRTFGAKDMSHLIPGHGGLVDRIDGFLFAAVAAALIALRDPADPGRGLLIW